MPKTFRVKEILVPIDFSAPSRCALRAAMLLAKRLKARLHLVYMHQPEPSPVGPEAAGAILALESLRSNNEAVSKRVRRKMLTWASSFKGPMTAGCYYGSPLYALPRLCREQGADMVVMGTQGATGLRRILRGSVAQAVMRRGGLPVLVTRSSRRRFNPRRIICPFNLKPYSAAALRYASSLARALKAELVVLYVHPPKLWEEDAKLNLLHEVGSILGKDAEGTTLRIVKGDKPLDVLATHLKNSRFDLAVIAEHARFWQKITGTTAERLLRAPTIPILSVP